MRYEKIIGKIKNKPLQTKSPKSSGRKTRIYELKKRSIWESDQKSKRNDLRKKGKTYKAVRVGLNRL